MVTKLLEEKKLALFRVIRAQMYGGSTSVIKNVWINKIKIGKPINLDLHYSDTLDCVLAVLVQT